MSSRHPFFPPPLSSSDRNAGRMGRWLIDLELTRHDRLSHLLDGRHPSLRNREVPPSCAQAKRRSPKDQRWSLTRHRLENFVPRGCLGPPEKKKLFEEGQLA